MLLKSKACLDFLAFNIALVGGGRFELLYVCVFLRLFDILFMLVISYEWVILKVEPESESVFESKDRAGMVFVGPLGKYSLL